MPKRYRKNTDDQYSNLVSTRGMEQESGSKQPNNNVILIVRKEYVGASSSQATNQNSLREKDERVQIETNADYRDIKRAVKEGNLKTLEVKPEEPPHPLLRMKTVKQAPSTNSQDLSHLNEPQPEAVIERCPKCNYSQTKGSSSQAKADRKDTQV